MATLGNRLKSERDKRGWTLGQVAVKLGLKGHSTYSNWEYDKRQPDHEMLDKLADLYDVSVDWLLGRAESHQETLPPDDEKISLEEYRRMLVEDRLTIDDKPIPEATKAAMLAVIDLALKQK